MLFLVVLAVVAGCSDTISSCPNIGDNEAIISDVKSTTVVCTYVGSLTCPMYKGWVPLPVQRDGFTVCTWTKIIE